MTKTKPKAKTITTDVSTDFTSGIKILDAEGFALVFAPIEIMWYALTNNPSIIERLFLEI